MERRRKKILPYYLLGCREEDVMMRKSVVAIELPGIIPSLSSNIYLMINPLLPPGLSKSCWFCSHHNPPGYLVRSDCSLREADLFFPVGVT